MCQENSSFVEIGKILCILYEDQSALMMYLTCFFAKCEKA